MNLEEFREAFDRHKDAIYRFAWRMTNSPEAAQDVAQEVFLGLLRRPEAFDPSRGELRGFLFGGDTIEIQSATRIAPADGPFVVYVRRDGADDGRWGLGTVGTPTP